MGPVLQEMLAKAVHDAWLERWGVARLLEEADATVIWTERCALAVGRLLDTDNASPDFVPALVALQESLDVLAHSMSRFPRRILAP